ncbi:MbnP family protein [uncultured Capnocytophaga sp.]|uniref:MbnP family protein n=1 Tax=uncultured Capnocytophaga sp. TaxID=159273 RepID=UPI00261D9592|nr:MbnP family protein [uncultured Capnocytophaga sp.]
MKNSKIVFSTIIASLALFSCTKKEETPTLETPTLGNTTLEFQNIIGSNPIELGADASTAKSYISNNQTLKFSEIKYIISNIRLVKTDGSTILYNVDNLDTGAFVLNQSNPESLKLHLSDLQTGAYKEILFDYGIRKELNHLDESRFPKFYKEAGKNDSRMHWEWGKGYRFTKIEGFWGNDNKVLSVHTGSTIKDRDTKAIGVDACRTVKLVLPKNLEVGSNPSLVVITADFDKLLNGSQKITLVEEDEDGEAQNNEYQATPNTHTALQIIGFINNLAGDNQTNTTGMFRIKEVK